MCLFLSFIFFITIAIGAGILIKAYSDTKNIWLLLFIAFLSLLSASQLAIAVVNFFATILVKPHLLLRRNYSNGIPDDFRKLFDVPVMLPGAAEIEN